MSQDGFSKRGCVLLNKRKIVKLAQKIACAAGAILLSFLCILPTFASDYPNYPEIEQSDVTYDLTQYPYLSFDIATARQLSTIDTYLTIDTDMLIAGQTDFVVGIDGGIEFVFDWGGINYIANARNASYRLNVRSGVNIPEYVNVLLDFILTDVQLYQVSETGWISVGEFPMLFSSFGLLVYTTDEAGHIKPETLQHYYNDFLTVEWLDDHTLEVPYAITMLNTGSLQMNDIRFARLNMYLPLGGSTGAQNVTQHANYYYGLGGLLSLSNINYLHPSVLAVLPTFGQGIIQKAEATDFTPSWWRGHEQGRQTGYTQGYNAGVRYGGKWNFGTIVSSIFDSIYGVFNSILNFDIPIGNTVINFAGIAGMLISLILIIIVVRFVLR